MYWKCKACAGIFADREALTAHQGAVCNAPATVAAAAAAPPPPPAMCVVMIALAHTVQSFGRYHTIFLFKVGLLSMQVFQGNLPHPHCRYLFSRGLFQLNSHAECTGNVFRICSSTCLLCYETGRTGDAAHWVDLPCCGQEMCSTCLDSLVAIPTSGRIKYVPASLLMLTAPELTTIWRPRCCLSVDLVSHFLCLNLCVPPVCHASKYPQSVLDASACFLLAGSRLPAPFARLHSLMRS